MTNRYYNHENPFMPGMVVRAEEANDQLDAIEVGFDRIDIMGQAIHDDVLTQIQGEIRPEIAAHKAETDSHIDMLKQLSEAEIQAIRSFAEQAIHAMQDDMTHVIKLPQSYTGNTQMPDRPVQPDSIPFINGQGEPDLLPAMEARIMADWMKVYLGRQFQPPTVDLSNGPLREGAMYYDQGTQKLMIYRNGQWVPGFISGSGVVTVSNIEPPVPVEGDLWFDTQTADLMIWYTDGTSDEWVVVNSNYNALFGPGIGPILSDGSVSMQAPLMLSPDDPGPQDAVSRAFLTKVLRSLGGPGTIYEPHVTDGIDPNVGFPAGTRGHATTAQYDVSVPGTMLFFGNFGLLHPDYGAPIAGTTVSPNDFVISTGVEWKLVQSHAGSFLAAADMSQPNPHPPGSLQPEDYIVHNGPVGVVDASWPGIAGMTIDPGDMAIWDGTQFFIIPTMSQLDNYVKKSGDAMSGVLDMGGFRIAGVANPVGPADVVNLRTLTASIGGQQVDWAQLTNVPATFPPGQHSANLLNTGVVNVARLPVGTTANDVAAGDHNHDARYFQKTEFINTSTGVTDAAKPVVLDATGHIDSSMIVLPSVSKFAGVTTVANLPGVGGAPGDTYILSSAGNVGATAAKSGDLVIWDGATWHVLASEDDLSAYLSIDGSGTMLGDLDVGANKIVNLANPTNPLDGVNLQTLNAQGGNYIPRADFLDRSTGPADAGKPVVLSVTGRLDTSIVSLPGVLTFRGAHAPNALLPNPQLGDVVIANAPGAVAGEPVVAGDLIIWDGTKWDVIPQTADFQAFLLRDGSNAMTADLNAGAHKVINLLDPTSPQDAVTLASLLVQCPDGTAAGQTLVWNAATSLWEPTAPTPVATAPQIHAGTNNVRSVTPLGLRGETLNAPTGGAGAVAGDADRLVRLNGAGAIDTGFIPQIPFTKITGVATAAQIPSLPFTKITGVATAAQIPNLNANKITAGTVALARLPTGTTAATVALGNHAHAWAAITGKPATFPPVIGATATTAAAGNHRHAWAAITGKPAVVTHAPALAANRLTIATAAANIKTGALYTNAAGNRLGVNVNPAQALHVNGQVVATNDITAFYSDMRLKEVVAPLDNALDKVASLEGFIYRPNDLALSVGAAEDDGERAGLSAQAVKAILPQAVSPAPFDMERDENDNIVSKSGEDYLTVDYAKLVPLLVEAINELNEKIRNMR